jgi:hypothetical protein
MKSIKLPVFAACTIVLTLLLSGCGETLWHAAQVPGLRGVSDRMNDRALQRRLSGDPLQELDQTTQQGDYRFLGLMDTDNNRNWVPGVPAGSYPDVQAVYLVTDHTQTWTSAAIRYFSTYNRALVARRQGKKLDSGGILVR